MKPGKTSPSDAEWRCAQAEPELAGRIAQECGIPPVTAQVLVNRGVRDAEAAGRFLKPSLTHLEDPAEMAGLSEAAGRIREAVGKSERILIFGDYDADGVTSSALLYELLKLSGGDCEVYLPSRTREGYGLTPEAAAEILRRRPDLVVTVDCGTGSPEEVASLQAEGIDVVVTDHHPPGAELPRAVAVVNPRRADCPYPFKDLAGVGVAFKLAWEIARRFSLSKKVSPELRRFLRDSVGLVALGTVADVAPLVGENRILVHYGLGVLAGSRHAGLRGLIGVAGLRGKPLTAEHIAFRLGPRLNAAGRTGSADSALALLLENDLERGHRAALDLDRANRERQRLEGKLLREIESLPELTDSDRRSIVLG
ncbi:MAG: single-stranded-DNA-specific exonuclease RecJ, partial [Planctomycetota bacterium]